MARILITGANGYIGRQLMLRLRATPHQLVVLSSRPEQFPADEKITVYPFRLGELIEPHYMHNIDVVIHLACACTSQNPDENAINQDVQGSRHLLEAARVAKVKRFVFISSQSAQEHAKTDYGKGKWFVEQLLTQPEEVIVRPGLVYGAEPAGLYAMLLRLAAFPILPNVGLDSEIQPIHVADLVEGLLTLAMQDKTNRKTYYLGQSTPISFKNFIRYLASQHYQRKPFFIKIPYFLVKWGCALTRYLPLVPTISIDRVDGLLCLQSMDTADSLTVLDLRLRKLQQAISLADEGRALLSYMQVQPTQELITAYVTAVYTCQDNLRVLLPVWLCRYPRWIAIYEPVSSSPLKQRINIACELLETTPITVDAFYNMQPMKKTRVYWHLAKLVLFESFCLPLRLLLQIGGRFGRR